MEQVKPRAHDHRLRAGLCAPGRRCCSQSAQLEAALFCDADHITPATVDRFLAPCDFFTFDVADFIGQAAEESDIDAFVKRHPELLGSIQLAGVDEAFDITAQDLRQAAQKFLAAVKKAGEVYRKVVSAKGVGNFIPEVSMDETDRAQSPVELLIILAAIADEGIPVRPSLQNSAAASTKASTMWAT